MRGSRGFDGTRQRKPALDVRWCPVEEGGRENRNEQQRHARQARGIALSRKHAAEESTVFASSSYVVTTERLFVAL